MRIKYDVEWVGVDAGRESLWYEPTWMNVLTCIASHSGEAVYDEHSAIYSVLEDQMPDIKWRSYTRSGSFRPLFRDYSHPWTRTGVAEFRNGIFALTNLGQRVISGKITKKKMLLRLFTEHRESINDTDSENPFAIISQALLDSPRPLSTKEMFWVVMKNYRPNTDQIEDVLAEVSSDIEVDPPAQTRYRRLRNFLTLLRASGAIESYRRSNTHYWGIRNKITVQSIAANL